MSGLQKLEYRVKQKTVYFLTRYCQVGDGRAAGGSATEEGTFTDRLSAQRAAVALMKSDAANWGVEEDDPRLTWPDPIPS